MRTRMNIEEELDNSDRYVKGTVTADCHPSEPATYVCPGSPAYAEIYECKVILFNGNGHPLDAITDPNDLLLLLGHKTWERLEEEALEEAAEREQALYDKAVDDKLDALREGDCPF